MKAEETGLKADEGKQGWFAMPLAVLQPLLDVFAAGEGHYGLHNCLKPFEDASRRFFDAQMRHVADSQLDPLATDPQDDCYHEAKVAFNALMRLYHCREDRENHVEDNLEMDPAGCANIPPVPVDLDIGAPFSPSGTIQVIAKQAVEDIGFKVSCRRATDPRNNSF